MKRIHLFEFEDLPWFPPSIRDCMTRLLPIVHKIVGTHRPLSELISRALQTLGTKNIVDLCSGNGGPMIAVVSELRKNHGLNVDLTLTDLYPHTEATDAINKSNSHTRYLTKPIDATDVDTQLNGLLTMVGSFHHMTSVNAKKILLSAQKKKQGLLIFEISDNRFPVWLWWMVLPFNFLLCLFITPFARPLTFQQLLFTYLVPIIPVCFAWDGAASNVRTYTLNDIDELLAGSLSDSYRWEKGKVGFGMLYVLGLPSFPGQASSQSAVLKPLEAGSLRDL